MKNLVLCSLLLVSSMFGQANYVSNIFPVQTSTGVTSVFTPNSLIVAQHTFSVIVNGSPSSCSIRVEGSLDGINWFDLSGSQTCTSSLMFHVVQKPITSLRMNLLSLSGGTSPSVITTYVGSK